MIHINLYYLHSVFRADGRDSYISVLFEPLVNIVHSMSKEGGHDLYQSVLFSLSVQGRGT